MTLGGKPTRASSDSIVDDGDGGDGSGGSGVEESAARAWWGPETPESEGGGARDVGDARAREEERTELADEWCPVPPRGVVCSSARQIALECSAAKPSSRNSLPEHAAAASIIWSMIQSGRARSAVLSALANWERLITGRSDGAEVASAGLGSAAQHADSRLRASSEATKVPACPAELGAKSTKSRPSWSLL